ncbi:MAG: DNA cytosine methyltransferase [Bacteroidetes bacterium]|nr:DNA cytosine methyltransferase [Bacteroidota bacterium]
MRILRNEPVMHRFIDLFSGIGGFHVALQQEGMDCVFASEIDDAAASVYQQNFGLKPCGDICEVPVENIPAHDILCAGFPCQPFSRSGKKEGFSDSRGRLFYEIVRIAKHHKPPLMLLENVQTILTMDDGKVKREIYKSLENAGYHLKHCVLNSGHFGIPQKRERVYFVAIRKNTSFSFTVPVGNVMLFKVVKDIVKRHIDTTNLTVTRDDIIFDRSKIQTRTRSPIRIGYLNKGGQGERIYSSNGLAITLAANSGGVGHRTGLYYIDNEVRRLHIDEAKSVMGFKTTHIVSQGIAGYRQLGNAVIPEMVTRIYKSVVNDK